MPTTPAKAPTATVTTKLHEALAARRAAMRKKFDALEAEAEARKTDGVLGIPRRWECLAEAMGVSEHTVAHWVRVGYVPRAMALAIERTYGAALASAEELGQVLIAG